MACEILDCPEPVNRDGLCLIHKLQTVHISGTATPTRYKGGYADPKQWDNDLSEYARARKSGLRPDHSTEKSARQSRRSAGDFETATA